VPATGDNQIGIGQQPQLTRDFSGVIRIIYGNKDKIYYSYAEDAGKTFSTPEVIAEIKDMHLGMTRGPQFATSEDYSVVTAIDKKGNIHAYQLNHKTKKWNALNDVNDIEGSAPEGLMSITADDKNNFYAVWLDLRGDRNNKIVFSSLGKNQSWSENKIIYQSLEKSVCECCKPSIAVKNRQVYVMFRNLINGFRDLYLISLTDGGVKFDNVIKLGKGTWKLTGCPMDGGGISIGKDNIVRTVWQRENVVYYDEPGKAESRIADGRSCNVFGTGNPLITWQEGDHIYGQQLDGAKKDIGNGTALSVVELQDEGFLAAWESDGVILFRKL
jgi:hypothetical protein